MYMNKTLLSAIALAVFVIITPASQVAAATVCSLVDGASIFGYDGGEWVFIGAIANEYNSLSIANEYGSGSEYKSTSINNEYGRYGGSYGSYSAFNNYASKPPIIINSDYELLGYLTTNEFKANSLNPYSALYCAQESFRSADRSMQDVTFTDSQVNGSSYSSVPAYTEEQLEDIARDEDSYRNIRNGYEVYGITFCDDGYSEDDGECTKPKATVLKDDNNSISDPANNARIRFVNSMKKGQYVNLEDMTERNLNMYSDEILELVPEEKIREYAPSWFVEKYVKDEAVSTAGVDVKRDSLLKQIEELLALIAVLQARI